MNTYIEQPALYIDYLQHIEQSVGVKYSFLNFTETGLDYRDLYGFRPSGASKRVQFDPSGGIFLIEFNKPIPSKFLKGMNYMALFGHNFASNQTSLNIKLRDTEDTDYSMLFYETVNGGGGLAEDFPDSFQYDNFSILGISASLPEDKEIKSLSIEVNGDIDGFNPNTMLMTIDIGSISLGRKFTFPTAVDLSSSVEFTHEGIEIAKTPTGRDIYQTKWTHQPNHGAFVPFQLYHAGDNPDLEIAKRSGRAKFKFQVSYLSDTKLISNFKLPHDTVGADIEHGYTPILSEQVVDGTLSQHPPFALGTQLNTFTHGGKLPMMLCGNVNNKDTNGWIKSDEFYIVRNSGDGFQFKPIAPDLYNINFSLIETW